MFFIDKDTAEGTEGRNVFISSIEKNGNETVTSATTGRIEWVGDRQFLMLNQGQRLENDPTTNQVKVSQFEQYGAQIGAGHTLFRQRACSQGPQFTVVDQGAHAWQSG